MEDLVISRPEMKDAFLSFLKHRRLPLFLAVVAVLLVLPSAWTGLQMDDFYHWYFLTGKTGADGRTLAAHDLFNFLDGRSERLGELMEAGILPWWTDRELRLSFWRPLSGLTHRLDYLLWPGEPWLMHVQSYAWFAGLIVLATLLFRRLNAGPVAAGLAALFFALDDAHGLAAGWLANRNALVAGCFGLAAILSHVRARSDGWKAGMLLGPLMWAAGLLSGEIAMGAGAFLLAWALCLDTASARSRAMSLVPYGALFAAWIAYHTIAGYGVHGSGFYVDPMHDPLRFLLAVGVKAPILLADQFGIPPSSLYMFLQTGGKTVLWIWAAALLAALLPPLLSVALRDRTGRFWAVGTLLSVPVICTTVPHGRLLIFTGLGGMGLVGLWCARYMEGRTGEGAGNARGGEWRRFVFGAFVLFHGILAPAMLPLNSQAASLSGTLVQEPISRMKLDAGISGKTLVVVGAPVFFYAQLIPTVLGYQGRPSPERLRVLAPGEGTIRITRADASRLFIRCEEGLLRSPFDNVFRDTESPMKPGESVRLGGMTVDIADTTPDGHPRDIVFSFSTPLEDTSLVWMKWENGDYVPFSLPAPGSTTVLTMPSMLRAAASDRRTAGSFSH